MFEKRVAGTLIFLPRCQWISADRSSGGRDAFKWEDVKDDQHRENYLGHSLMARKVSLTLENLKLG